MFATPHELHDVFMELCSPTLILDKRMGFNLKKNKGLMEVERLKVQLTESTTSLPLQIKIRS